jgi:beta-RFAP synthase
MIRMQAPSRLHFGLLTLPGGERWPNWEGEGVVPARRFGGVGLMVQQPGIALTARPAQDWSAKGPLAERVLAFARQFAAAVPPEQVRPQHLVVEQAPSEHAGLGTGTQLGLAVGRALVAAWGLGPLDPVALARRVGRGQRSALGIHGFAHGGFLVEGGKQAGTAVSPLLARVDFPEAWRIVLIIPPHPSGVHGEAEALAFARLGESGPGAPLELTESLCRLVLLGLLPALVERDLAAFGEALHDFNARAGKLFAGVQRGTYATPQAMELVRLLRRQGVRGVGQSSWGPAVFAVVADEDEGRHVARMLRERLPFAPGEVLVTAACNRGARVEEGIDRST